VAINAAVGQFREFLRIRQSSPAFSLGSAEEICKRLSFLPGKGTETPGVIGMRIDTSGIDPRWDAILTIFNARPQTHIQPIDVPAGAVVALHPVQASSIDPVVRRSVFNAADGTLEVPPRTVAVFTQS
jgi:hypothetical protein